MPGVALSQLRIVRPLPPLSFEPTAMKDAQCAETNEKFISRFLFLELSWKFIENWSDFEYKNDHNSKKWKSENWYFFWVSTLRNFHESGIKTEGGGICIAYP